MWKDFKTFLARGNVLDLAIGVIIGAAFSKIVTTFTEKMIMPIVGRLTGNVDFSKKFIDLSGTYSGSSDPKALEEAIKSGVPLIMYGQFITDIINFIIVGFIMFLIAKWAMGLFTKFAADTPPPPQEVLLTEIRDILAKK